jgi:hypothetical protein
VAALPLAVSSAMFVLLGATGVIVSRRRGRRPPSAARAARRKHA